MKYIQPLSLKKSNVLNVAFATFFLYFLPLIFSFLKSIICYIIHTFYIRKEIVMNHPQGKYAWTVTVGEKGQIVIPKQAREIFDINPGDTLILLADEKQGIAIPPKHCLADLTAKIFAQKSDYHE